MRLTIKCAVTQERPKATRKNDGQLLEGYILFAIVDLPRVEDRRARKEGLIDKVIAYWPLLNDVDAAEVTVILVDERDAVAMAAIPARKVQIRNTQCCKFQIHDTNCC